MSHGRTVEPASLLCMLPEELAELHPPLTVPEARRLLSLAHRHGQLPAVTPAGLRRGPYQLVRARCQVPSLTLVERRDSQIDPFVKYAFRTADGAIIESVRIPLEREGRFVACVSSQAGCAMGCAFCATGRLGLRRNLHAWEIIEQVRLIRQQLPEGGRIHGVVFQGMGEPLANVRAVIRAVRVLCDPSLLAVDARAITVSTAGFLPGLAPLVSAVPNVRIGLSIGSTLSETRRKLIPIDKSFPLRSVLQALAETARQTRIAPMWSYTLLEGINDTDADVEALGELADWFWQTAEVRPRLSLIEYNSIGHNDPFTPASKAAMERFRTVLGQRGVPVVRRYSGGADIAAACGQLGTSLHEPRAASEPDSLTACLNRT